MSHKTVYIPIMIEPHSKVAESNCVAECGKMFHPETSSDAKALPFVWSIALLRFLSRASLKIDKFDRGVLPCRLAVYRLKTSGMASLWELSLSPVAQKILNALLTGTSKRVLCNRVPGACMDIVVSARDTMSTAEMRMSVDNVVICALEEASGVKIARGAKRSMWNKVECIETAMFAWTAHALKHLDCPKTNGWVVALGNINSIESKNSNIANAVQLLWKTYILSRPDAAAPPPTRGSDDAAGTTYKKSPPFPERIRVPLLLPNFYVHSQILLDDMMAKILVDEASVYIGSVEVPPPSPQNVDSDEIVFAVAENLISNELIVQSVIGRTPDAKGSISPFSIVPRLDRERQLWGLTRSLLI